MENMYNEDRLILQLLERLTRVETKIDSLVDAIQKSNDKFISIENNISSINQRIGKVEIKADRANLRLDESKAMVIKVGTVTSTLIGILVNIISVYLAHK